jgi:hypothetical protein
MRGLSCSLLSPLILVRSELELSLLSCSRLQNIVPFLYLISLQVSEVVPGRFCWFRSRCFKLHTLSLSQKLLVRSLCLSWRQQGCGVWWLSSPGNDFFSFLTKVHKSQQAKCWSSHLLSLSWQSSHSEELILDNPQVWARTRISNSCFGHACDISVIACCSIGFGL